MVAMFGWFRRGQRLRLAAEARTRQLIGDPPVGEHLDGDTAVKAEIPGEVDHAHAARAKAALDLVVAEVLADHDVFDETAESLAQFGVCRSVSEGGPE